MAIFEADTEHIIHCPHCQSDVALRDAADWVSCPSCGKRLNVSAQHAFARAELAFLSVQEDVFQASLRGTGRHSFRAKARPDSLPLPTGIIKAYQQAYSGLRLALRYGLSVSQRLASYEMMAEITRQFAPRAMVSPIEAEYWVKLAVELTARTELAAIETALSGHAGGGPARLRQRLRRYQLTKALAGMAKQIQELERVIGFIDAPPEWAQVV